MLDHCVQQPCKNLCLSLARLLRSCSHVRICGFGWNFLFLEEAKPGAALSGYLNEYNLVGMEAAAHLVSVTLATDCSVACKGLCTGVGFVLHFVLLNCLPETFPQHSFIGDSS